MIKERKRNDDSNVYDSNVDDRVSAIIDDFLIVCNDDVVVNLACHETSWVIDNAKAEGMGDVCLETNNGTMLLLKNVS
ncbi:hypothetical protein EZV62_004810 [Acer yangbiense]|uniref:Uncharacterized protein n=1 Tax=Acer yangbiense TaxID=1000413 RepID=A0A5C7IL10_9ROSI|nr:hypothetical protein EZV62_004810 [Acer yangbiense]